MIQTMALQFLGDFQRVTARMRPAVERIGKRRLAAAEVFALAYLCDLESCDVAQMCRTLGLAPSTLSSLLNRLERRGLLKRTLSSRDRRTFALVLTPEGRSEAERARTGLEMIEQTLIEKVSYGHLMAFTEVIEALDAALQYAQCQSPEEPKSQDAQDSKAVGFSSGA